MTPSELSRVAGRALSTVSKYLDDMVEEGLIGFRVNESDRRSKIYYLMGAPLMTSKPPDPKAMELSSDILTDIVALYKGYHRYQHEYVDVGLAELPVCTVNEQHFLPADRQERVEESSDEVVVEVKFRKKTLDSPQTRICLTRRSPSSTSSTPTRRILATARGPGAMMTDAPRVRSRRSRMPSRSPATPTPRSRTTSPSGRARSPRLAPARSATPAGATPWRVSPKATRTAAAARNSMPTRSWAATAARWTDARECSCACTTAM